MKSFAKVKSFFKNEKGATMLEYAIVAGLIAVVVIGGVTAFGTELNTAFGNLTTQLTGSVGKSTPTTP